MRLLYSSFLIFNALLFFNLNSSIAFSHGNEVHHKENEKKKPEEKHLNHDSNQIQIQNAEPTRESEAFKKITESYQEILPIFKKACFDCHSNQTKFPWYADLPIASSVIKKDIKDAKSHLEFKETFPFGGHGTPIGDLNAIKESINNGSMPPLRYKAMHWDAFLSQKEKNAIFDWIKKSKSYLKP